MNDERIEKKYKEQRKEHTKEFLHSATLKIILFVTLIVIITTTLLFIYLEWASFSNYSTYLSLISSIFMVLITLAYVIFTHEQVKLLSKQIINSEKPSVYAKISFTDNERYPVVVDIENVSDYAAINLYYNGFIVIQFPGIIGMNVATYDLAPLIFPAIKSKNRELHVTKIDNADEFFELMDDLSTNKEANIILVYSIIIFKTLSGRTLKTDSVQKFFYDNSKCIAPYEAEGYSFDISEATREDIAFARNSDRAFEELRHLFTSRDLYEEKRDDRNKKSGRLIMMPESATIQISLFPEYSKTIKNILEEHGYKPLFKYGNDYSDTHTIKIGRFIKHNFIQFKGSTTENISMKIFLNKTPAKYKILYPEDISEHKEKIIEAYENIIKTMNRFDK